MAKTTSPKKTPARPAAAGSGAGSALAERSKDAKQPKRAARKTSGSVDKPGGESVSKAKKGARSAGAKDTVADKSPEGRSKGRTMVGTLAGGVAAIAGGVAGAVAGVVAGRTRASRKSGKAGQE